MDSSLEIVDCWMEAVKRGQPVAEIIQHKREQEELFRSIYTQLADKWTKIKKKSDGGYFVSDDQKKKTIIFNACGGSKAR